MYPTQHEAKYILVAGCVILLVLCAFWVFYSGMQGARIQFNIPTGFSGPILLREDSNGEQLRNDGQKYVVHVPPSGVIRCRDVGVFERWARITVVDADGIDA